MLNQKAQLITNQYQRLWKPQASLTELFKAMAASVLLESFLFYSGFFYPLYLSGQGRMTASGEIINLILRDESIHGLYMGMLAQEVYHKLQANDQEDMQQYVYDILLELYELELVYTEDIYASLGLQQEVTKFLRYNANKALMNLGFPAYFEAEEINPIVENGLRTDTKNHDFFSLKGNSYFRSLHVEKLCDEDFLFEAF